MGPLLLMDATHSCWEVIRLMVVGFPDASAAGSQDAMISVDERHDHCQNDSYALVNSMFFRVLAHGPYSSIPVNGSPATSEEQVPMLPAIS